MKLELSQNVLNRRVFKQDILNTHIKDYMLGQTQRFLDKQHSAIDVGAATGMYSSFFCRHAKQVHAFEAVLPVYNQLIKVKEMCSNLKTYNYAVSKENGTADFYVDDKRLSNSGFQNLVGGQKVEVKTVSLDSMGFSDVNFIKIDVEGNELDVLYGAQKLIDDYKPTCMVEVYDKYNKYPIQTTFDFFFDRGYSCYFNRKKMGLYQAQSLDHAIEVCKTMVNVTDGDFLFVYE